MFRGLLCLSVGYNPEPYKMNKSIKMPIAVWSLAALRTTYQMGPRHPTKTALWGSYTEHAQACLQSIRTIYGAQCYSQGAVAIQPFPVNAATTHSNNQLIAAVYMNLANYLLMFVAKKQPCKTVADEFDVSVGIGHDKSTHRDVHSHGTTVGLHLVICNIRQHQSVSQTNNYSIQ